MATVLVVDDDAGVLLLVSEILTSSGLGVMTAANANEALLALGAHDIDLVLLDVALPGTTGYSVVEEIRHTPAWRTLPVLLLTASGPGQLVTGLESGADDYIAKPFAVDELLARVRAHLRSRERWRAVTPAPTNPVPVGTVLRSGAFAIAFQPVIDLSTMQPVGHEALARFADGRGPAEVFAAAHEAGLGVQLELAAATAALASSRQLDPGSWLSVNLSPAALLASADLRPAVKACGRRVIIELTEHERVADYPSLTAAAARLGGDVTLAVDDAGAGYASLSHVIALHPALVKLDRAWVDGISDDPVRRALVRGVLGIADATGSTVVAEGIERDEDLMTVRELGVGLGQGYLLGRPALSAA